MQSTVVSSPIVQNNLFGGNQSLDRGSSMKGGNIFDNAIDKKGRNIFVNDLKSEKAIVVVDNPFRQLNNMQLSQEKRQQLSQPSIMEIIQQLTFPCCHNTLCISHDYKLSEESILYSMPCKHTICRQCINLALTNENNGLTLNSNDDSLLIECWHPECGEGYSKELAERMFIENKLVMSWVRKMLFLGKEENEIVRMGCEENRSKDNFNRRKVNLVSSKSATNLFFSQEHKQQQPIYKVHYNREEEEEQEERHEEEQEEETINKSIQQQQQQIQPYDQNKNKNKNNIQNNNYINNTINPTSNLTINETESSSEDSSETLTYNPCVNMFCRNPTVGFYCSEECDALIEKLESVKIEVKNFLKSLN